MKTIYVVLLALAVAGCAGMTGPPAGTNATLTEGQMKAMVSDKNATAFCGVATGPWGKISTVYVVVDNRVIADGGFAVDDACKVMFTNTPQPRVVAPPVVRPAP